SLSTLGSTLRSKQTNTAKPRVHRQGSPVEVRNDRPSAEEGRLGSNGNRSSFSGTARGVRHGAPRHERAQESPRRGLAQGRGFSGSRPFGGSAGAGGGGRGE